MISTARTSPSRRSPEAGSASAGSSARIRPREPPTSGCCSAKYAAANEPVIAMPNWIMSVTSTPHSPDVRQRRRYHRADQQRLPHRPAEHDVGDLGGGQVHRRHDHAVEEEPEIDGAEPAHPRGGLARVAHLVELEIGEHARAAARAARRRTPSSCRSAGTPTTPSWPATPRSRTRLVTRFGVSVLNVVATIETPTSHHGAARPDVKNSAVLDPARRASKERRDERDDDGGGDDRPVEWGE